MKKIVHNHFISITGLTMLTALTLHGQSRYVAPVQRVEKYSVTRSEPIPIPAKTARLPLIVYGEEKGKSGAYAPSGWMGDTDALKMGSESNSAPLSDGREGRVSMKIQYLAKGAQGWVGVFWQSPSNNWGTVKAGGYDLSKAKRLTFWMRGDQGGEVISQVKIGGISSGTYPDTDQIAMGPIRLTTQWEQYELDLRELDLRHIIGGFCFVLKRVDAPRSIKFYLDEIVYDEVEPGTMKKEPVAAVDPDDSPEPATPVQAAVVPAVVEPPTPPAEPIHKTIHFDTAKPGLNKETKQALDEIVEACSKSPDVSIVIEGHTDSQGGAELNRKLSLRRANSIGDYLAAHGVDPKKMVVTGYGEDRLLVPETKNVMDARRQNRRVEITVVPAQP